METSADVRLCSASSHINQAIKDLSSCVTGESYGMDEYKTEYQEMVNDVLIQLIQIRRKFNRD